MMLRFVVEVVVVVCVCCFCDGFPDGAPIDACVKERTNQPNHGQHRTQPLSTSPYTVTASSVNYSPGERISVCHVRDEIRERSCVYVGPRHCSQRTRTRRTVSIVGTRPFKGFFIQARSIKSDQWLGSWEETPNTMVHPECVAITHADPRNKTRATFVWDAPPNARGRVYFTGTVLQSYATFWANLIAEAPLDPATLQVLACGDGVESMKHILCECDALSSKRRDLFGLTYPRSEDYRLLRPRHITNDCRCSVDGDV